MPSPSKTKGKTWERDVAHFLTEMYGETFIRVQNSGAYVGGQNAFRKQTMHEFQILNMKGDIVPGPSFPHLNIECKSYKSFTFHKLFFFGEHIKQLDEWIDQLLGAADKGDLNLLIMKFNNVGKYVMFETKNSYVMELDHGLFYQSKNHGPFYFMEFDRFWEINKEAVKTLSAPTTVADSVTASV